MIKQILYMSVLWTTLIFIGYNLLTTAADNKTNNMTIPNEAEGSTTTDSDSPKEICKDYDGKWKDSTCNFKNEDEDDEVAFDHYLADEGLWDDYVAAKQEDKEKENESEDNTIVEDWRNTVEVEEKEPEQIILEQWEKAHGSTDNFEISSPRIISDEEREKYEKEREKNEVETVEPTDDDGTPEPEPEEEEEEEQQEEESEDEDSGGGEDEE